MANSIISIIIPTYNRAHFIGETLDSILNQTYKHWECIVVDDQSTDHTDEIMDYYCKNDPRIKFFSRPQHKKKGPNSCRNFGYEKSKGSFINWIDSDDILFQNALEKKIKNIGINDLLVSTVKYVDELNQPIDLTHKYFSENNLIEDYFMGNVTFYTFTPLWKKTFLDSQQELFDEDIFNLDDWDFNLRMLYQNPRIKYLHEPLIFYRLHKNSLSQEIYNLNFKELLSEFNARKKHFKILKENKNVNMKVLKTYDMKRCKQFLRTALSLDHPRKNSLYKILVIRQLELGDFHSLFKTSLGFISMSLFGRGDKMFR